MADFAASTPENDQSDAIGAAARDQLRALVARIERLEEHEDIPLGIEALRHLNVDDVNGCITIALITQGAYLSASSNKCGLVCMKTFSL